MQKWPIAIFAALIPAPAFANGAFPESFSIFTPASDPTRIVLPTNFGMLISDDDGATFGYVCEQAIAPLASLYQVGPPATHLMFATSYPFLAVSRDRGCSWQATGSLERLETTDVWPDPTDPLLVYAIARPKTSTGTYRLLRSIDGAVSFPDTLLTVSSTTTLQSVESARTDPQIVYATSWSGFPPFPAIHRSTDGGAHFTQEEAGFFFGTHVTYIAAIGRTNPQRVYFRVLATSALGDSLGISDDGGITGRIALELPVRMSAFLERQDGTLIVGTRANGGYISTDDGLSFSPWQNSPHILGLSERDGVVYAATDNFPDGYAVGRTRDDGQTWERLLRFEDVDTIYPCGELATLCEQALRDLKATLEMSQTPDAGPITPPPPPPPPPPGSGSSCGCSSVVLFGLVRFLVPRSRGRPRAPRRPRRCC